MKRVARLPARAAGLLLMICGIPCFLVPASTHLEEDRAKISFEITSVKSTLHEGEKLKVRFMVINHGTMPVHFARGFLCSKWTGFVDFTIVDPSGNKVPMSGCDSVVWSIANDRLKQEVTSSLSWVRLETNELYGEELSFDLPQKKGPYRLLAELRPPQFSDQQRQILTSAEVHVLEARQKAAPLIINVE